MNANVGETLTIRGQQLPPRQATRTPWSSSATAPAPCSSRPTLGTAKMLTRRRARTRSQQYLSENGSAVPRVPPARALRSASARPSRTGKSPPIIGAAEAGRRRRRARTTSRSRAPDGDCDGDGPPRQRASTPTTTTTCWPTRSRTTLGLDPCKADTDGDGVEDGYEYRSALDLNDDEYQEPQQLPAVPGQAALPEPAVRGRGHRLRRRRLTLIDEYRLWKSRLPPAGRRRATLQPAVYSDGEQYSLLHPRRRRPPRARR